MVCSTRLATPTINTHTSAHGAPSALYIFIFHDLPHVFVNEPAQRISHSDTSPAGGSTFARSTYKLARPSAAARRLNHTGASNGGKGPDRTTHFGFQTVPEEQEESLVKGVFNLAASSYDVMNDAMSLGVHQVWKDEYVSSLKPGAKGPLRCIDVAGGKGDIALRILDHARQKYADRETTVDIVDISGGVLREGFKRAIYPGTPQVAFIGSNSHALLVGYFPDNTYDLYTIAFGIRNCTSVPDVLKEAYRVLKPGGAFACLEFSKVNNPLFNM
ncbi:hypothetical protein BDW22DRAFT_1336929 [Trametopsis cervina]|nr:hypothetical protein BDW22DRAFT_1336929 [Trametopsis cervina]